MMWEAGDDERRVGVETYHWDRGCERRPPSRTMRLPKRAPGNVRFPSPFHSEYHIRMGYPPSALHCGPGYCRGGYGLVYAEEKICA
jgi:hypothetical protein